MGVINFKNKIELAHEVSDVVQHPSILKDPKFDEKLVRTALSVKEVREMLSGWKTYLCMAGLAGLTIAHMLGYIDDATYQHLSALLAAGGISALRAGVDKAQSAAALTTASK